MKNVFEVDEFDCYGFQSAIMVKDMGCLYAMIDNGGGCGF